jgi:glutathione synthase/RimK-type ligase-like ATP-grasp enzyme
MPRDDLSFGARFLRAAAERRGWEVTLHPDGAFAGEIRLPDGTTRFFYRSTYDINSAGATYVARDKSLTKFFLGHHGYPVLPGHTIFSRDDVPELAYPVMVKANGEAAGAGIARVDTAEELNAALDRAFAFGKIVLIEPYVADLRDYRLLVLDGELLLAYERIPYTILGDGHSTIRELTHGREDIRLRRHAPSDVLRDGESLRVLDVANLSQGGSAREISPAPALAQLAIDAARAMNLRFCGVDILTDDADTHWILELNASPTIHHFAALCALTDDRLASIFERVLLAMVRT